jgi:hypothetical protein
MVCLKVIKINERNYKAIAEELSCAHLLHYNRYGKCNIIGSWVLDTTVKPFGGHYNLFREDNCYEARYPVLFIINGVIVIHKVRCRYFTDEDCAYINKKNYHYVMEKLKNEKCDARGYCKRQYLCGYSMCGIQQSSGATRGGENKKGG